MLFWICEYSSLQNKRYYFFFRVSQVSEGKREVAGAWCARHANGVRRGNGLLGVCLGAEWNKRWFVDRRYFLRAFPVARVLRCIPASCSPEKHEKVAPALRDYSIV